MNQTQRNYAIERVKQAAHQKVMELDRERYKAVTPPTADEIHDALKSGKAKLKSKKVLQDLVKADRYGDRRNPSKLSLEEVFNNLPKPKGKAVDGATVEKKRKEIFDRVRVVTDEIMLGDETKAMKMIADFEKELAKK